MDTLRAASQTTATDFPKTTCDDHQQLLIELKHNELTAVPLANGMVKAKTGNTTDATTYADWYKAVYVPAAESDVATQSQSASKPAKAVTE